MELPWPVRAMYRIGFKDKYIHSIMGKALVFIGERQKRRQKGDALPVW